MRHKKKIRHYNSGTGAGGAGAAAAGIEAYLGGGGGGAAAGPLAGAPAGLSYGNGAGSTGISYQPNQQQYAPFVAGAPAALPAAVDPTSGASMNISGDPMARNRQGAAANLADPNSQLSQFGGLEEGIGRAKDGWGQNSPQDGNLIQNTFGSGPIENYSDADILAGEGIGNLGNAMLDFSGNRGKTRGQAGYDNQAAALEQKGYSAVGPRQNTGATTSYTARGDDILGETGVLAEGYEHPEFNANPTGAKFGEDPAGFAQDLIGQGLSYSSPVKIGQALGKANIGIQNKLLDASGNRGLTRDAAQDRNISMHNERIDAGGAGEKIATGGTTFGASANDKKLAENYGFDSVYDMHEAQSGSKSSDRKDREAQVAQTAKLKNSPAVPNLSGASAKTWLQNNGYGNVDKKEAADMMNGLRQQQQAGRNNGGPIGYNRGGGVNDRKKVRVAQSMIQDQAPPPRQAGATPGPQVQQGGSEMGNMMKGLGKKALTGALTGALGPLGGMLGGLFNDGGQIPMQNLNAGGWLKALFGGGEDKPQRRSRPLPEGYTKSKSSIYRQGKGSGLSRNTIGARETRPDKLGAAAAAFRDSRPIQSFNMGGPLAGYNQGGQASLGKQIGWAGHGNTDDDEQSLWSKFKSSLPSFSNPNKAAMQAAQRRPDQKSIWEKLGRNDGGAINMQNPQGYNEGGQTMETPIKKQQELQKLQLAQDAFDMSEARKDEVMMMDEERKKEAHEAALKMKKDSQVMKKGPLG